MSGLQQQAQTGNPGRSNKGHKSLYVSDKEFKGMCWQVLRGNSCRKRACPFKHDLEPDAIARFQSVMKDALERERNQLSGKGVAGAKGNSPPSNAPGQRRGRGHRGQRGGGPPAPMSKAPSASSPPSTSSWASPLNVNAGSQAHKTASPASSASEQPWPEPRRNVRAERVREGQHSGALPGPPGGITVDGIYFRDQQDLFSSLQRWARAAAPGGVGASSVADNHAGQSDMTRLSLDIPTAALEAMRLERSGGNMPRQQPPPQQQSEQSMPPPSYMQSQPQHFQVAPHIPQQYPGYAPQGMPGGMGANDVFALRDVAPFVLDEELLGGQQQQQQYTFPQTGQGQYYQGMPPPQQRGPG